MHAKISDPENYKVGIKATLIPELQEFLKGKDKNYRLLFLVDEVSQYVGTNKEILLNFQNIIERVSNDCNNQVWIACTAQQTLDEVSGGADGVADVQDEFGKILGRFDTRISLQSNDASYITQRRVLDKNSNGTEYLSDLYHNNKDYIDNQFKINHDLYKGYKSIDEFIIGYPFVPYQFKLIAHMFEAFQQLGYVIKQVKDNERSILGITHFTAKEHANDTVGGFMPFDAFFNGSLRDNLTHRGRKSIQNAFDLPYVQNNPFAERVVKVLFMISNLLENQRQTFPSNVENLGVLLMDALDQNKKELQKEITKVLDRLSEESIIREEKGSYFFFNEDEMDVQNIIKNQTLILDDRFNTFDKEFFRPLINLSQKVQFGQNDFKVGYAIEGKEVFRNGDFNITVLLSDNTPLVQKALDIDKKEIIVAVNEWFNNDETLKKEFDWYCRTNKYFLNNPTGGTGDRSRTNDNFRVRNNQLKEKIVNSIKLNFADTRFVSQNTILEPSDINGTTPADRFKNVIEAHLKGIYKYHELSNSYARNQQELKKSVMDNQVLMETLEPAEQMVNDFISLNNNQITVYDLIKHFEKEPFGWRFEAVLDIVVRLEKKKKREFKYKNIERYNRVEFINKAVSTAERTSCEVVSSEEIDQDTLDNVLAAYKNIFNEVLTGEHIQTDQNKLFDALKHSLSKKERSFSDLESYYKKEAFGNCFSDAKKAMNQIVLIADLKKQFRAITEDQEQLKELLDTVKAIEDFAASSLSKYTEIKSFVSINNDNFKLLATEDLEKVKKVNHFFTLEDPRKEFRHIVKAYDELEQAITAKIKELKDTTIKAYETVFTELETEATKHKVAKNVFSDKEYTLNGIKNLTSLSGLKSKFLEVSNFKAKELEKIIKAIPVAAGDKAAESSIYYVAKGISTITTEKELDQYLLKLRREMLQLLKDKKNIIIK